MALLTIYRKINMILEKGKKGRYEGNNKVKKY